MAGYLADVGQRLGKAVESYNRAIGSLESRVIVTARKFRDLHVGTEQQELQVLEPIEVGPRKQTLPETTPLLPHNGRVAWI
jgi:DNA recombination protein RmuC